VEAFAIAVEETDESEYWLGVAVTLKFGAAATAKRLHVEAAELTRIFAKSAGTARSRDRRR
jgi:hypothetical protein